MSQFHELRRYAYWPIERSAVYLFHIRMMLYFERREKLLHTNHNTVEVAVQSGGGHGH